MIFFNSGYGYEKSNEGYVLSHGQVPSERTHKYIDVWSAFHGLPPEGVRLMNGSKDHFYSRSDAIAACGEHAGRVGCP